MRRRTLIKGLSIPARAFDAKPQPDHNELTDEPQFAAIENRPFANSTAKPQSDHIPTHKFHANSMPMSGHAVLVRFNAYLDQLHPPQFPRRRRF